MLSHEQDGHDAAQDTMVKVLRNLDRYDPGRPFATWVFQIARNTCIDEHRRRRRRPSREAKEIADDRNPSPLQIAASQQRAEILEQALQDLPPMYREVIVLYHFEHKKYTEIAEVLDLPMGTVMNRLFRARKKLRLAYEERGGDSP